jgi:hypothetical protein
MFGKRLSLVVTCHVVGTMHLCTDIGHLSGKSDTGRSNRKCLCTCQVENCFRFPTTRLYLTSDACGQRSCLRSLLQIITFWLGIFSNKVLSQYVVRENIWGGRFG